jgi:Yip1 domain
MTWQTIFNPFSKYTEKQLTLAGVLITIVGTIIGYHCGVSFNGVLDVHLVDKTFFTNTLSENAINLVTITLLLFLLGKYLNSKTRIIDIINMALWYRLPIYASALLAFLLLPKDLNEKIVKNVEHPEKIFGETFDIIMAALFAMASLLLITYSIVLLTNGFKTATNTKKWQHFVAFGFAILIAEGISQFILLKLF